jgi:hypothetical protein
MSTPASATWCPTPPDPVPDQGRVQLAGHEICGSLAHEKWRPLLMTGLLRQLMVGHYSKLENIESPDLVTGDSPAIWQDTLQTGIMIESVHRWRGDLTQKRPAILVKRNAYRNMRIAIGDRKALDGQGFIHYTTLWVGSHTLFCIHGTGASCEILATESQRHLTQVAPAVVQLLDLLRFQVTEVGAISEVEEATQNYVVPVTVAWAYQENWKLVPEQPPLQGVAVEVNVEHC